MQFRHSADVEDSNSLLLWPQFRQVARGCSRTVDEQSIDTVCSLLRMSPKSRMEDILYSIGDGFGYFYVQPLYP